MNTANWNIEPHAARAALQLRPGPFVAGAGQGSRWRWAPWARCRPASASSKAATIPYTPDAKKQRDENRAD